MKSLILITVILFISAVSFGQANKMALGVSGSVHCFYIKPMQGSNYKFSNSLEHGLGLNLQYNLASRLFATGAVQFSRRVYSLNYNYKFRDPGDPFIPRATVVKSNYLSIPVFIGYYLYNGDKFNFAPSLGLIGERLIGDNETTLFEDNSTRESQYLNQNNYLASSQLNCALEYQLIDKVILCLHTCFGLGFNKIESEIMISNPISFGGNFNVKYLLN